MPRNLTRPLLPTLILIALVLLAPTLATAQSTPLNSAAERLETAPGPFAKLWDLLSAVWMTGPGLEPNGANAGPSSGSDSEPNTATGDTGSGLDPNG